MRRLLLIAELAQSRRDGVIARNEAIQNRSTASVINYNNQTVANDGSAARRRRATWITPSKRSATRGECVSHQQRTPMEFNSLSCHNVALLRSAAQSLSHASTPSYASLTRGYPRCTPSACRPVIGRNEATKQLDCFTSFAMTGRHAEGVQCG
jgi:hypothetical protein